MTCLLFLMKKTMFHLQSAHTETSITKIENVQTSVSFIITTYLRGPGYLGFLNYMATKKYR
jgi:hypothetical protein